MGGSLRKRLWIGGALVVALVLAMGAAFAVSTWNEVNRVSIDRPSSSGPEAAAAEPEAEPQPDSEPVASATVPPSEDGLDVFLLVGSDSRADLPDLEGFGDFEGQRADVVMVLLKPRDRETAAVLSLPRDLLVDDICNSGERRLNQALEECAGSMNGPTSLLVTVERLIGLGIDHFALVDLAGFQEAVDAIGGYEICLDLPVRDSLANLSLPAGCTLASGAETLAWLRSRHTQELTDTGWRMVPGVNDLTRNERQRSFLISMMARLGDFSSPDDAGALAQAVAPYVTVDSGLSFIDAIGLAWTMRGLGTSSISNLEVPVIDATTDAGAAVLVATMDISDIVAAYLEPVTAGSAALSISR